MSRSRLSFKSAGDWDAAQIPVGAARTSVHQIPLLALLIVSLPWHVVEVRSIEMSA